MRTRFAPRVLATLAVAGLVSALLVVAPRPGPRMPTSVVLAAAHPTAGTHRAHRRAHHRAHPWRGHPGRRVLGYTVRRGDTATGLAVRFHAWTDELLAINHLTRRSTLYVGDRLKIPVVVAAARRAHRHAAHRHTHRAQHRHAHRAQHRAQHRARHHARRRHDWRGGHASRARVRRTVARIASRYHVGPNLALAIAWEESGWRQQVISPAHAIGVMQVLPSTGRWVSTYAGRRLHLYHLGDNVAAGVVLIRLLRREADRRHAVAGYYQGLASVRRDGMYRSTRHYVASVLALRRHLRNGWHPEVS